MGRNVQKLVQYHEEHNHCSVKRSEDVKLYSWVYNQRYNYRKGNLKLEKKELLGAIDFLAASD